LRRDMTASYRYAANILAARSGVPSKQDGIDKFWSGIVERLNTTLSNREPIGARLASPDAAGGRPDNAAVDWASIAARLNAEAGLKAPARSHR